MKRSLLRWFGAAVSLPAALSVSAGPVNINTADAETLARELNGIGPVVAAEIVRDRESNGRFENPDDLTRVNGVGQRILERNREFILIDAGAPPQ